MDDTQASVCLDAAMTLALTIRDEGPEAVAAAARELLHAAGGDPIAALAVAAALVHVDEHVQPWWQPDTAATRRTVERAACGTRAALNRHRELGELIDDACREAERRYERARVRRRESKAPRELAPCGTHAAYERHRRRGETIDTACRKATIAYKVEKNRARRIARKAAA